MPCNITGEVSCHSRQTAPQHAPDQDLDVLMQHKGRRGAVSKSPLHITLLTKQAAVKLFGDCERQEHSQHTD